MNVRDIVAAHAGDPLFLPHVEAVVRVTSRYEPYLFRSIPWERLVDVQTKIAPTIVGELRLDNSQLAELVADAEGHAQLVISTAGGVVSSAEREVGGAEGEGDDSVAFIAAYPCPGSSLVWHRVT